ncbi:MAG: DUF1330 domain-containing protein [Salaquimonas sp.]
MPNYIDPTKESFGHFKDLASDKPVQMLNLVRLNDKAVYEDGSVVTGAEAYAAYSKESGPIFARLGGKIIWSGDFELTLIGPANENWDIAFIAEYPTGQAFIDMVRDPEYRKAVRHRQAAVKTSRLVRMKPKAVSKEFG